MTGRYYVGPNNDPERDLSTARSFIPGVSITRKFGRHAAVPNTERAIVLGLTTDAPYMPTAAVTVQVRSSDANDTVAGTGARTVTIDGLDANFAEVSQTVNMNGIAAVTLPTQLIRVYRARVASSGAYASGATAGTNIGTLTIESSVPVLFFEIAPGFGQTQCCHVCVPAGYTMYLKDIHFSIEANTTCDVKLIQRENADDVTAAYSPARIVGEYDGVVGQIDYDYHCSQTFAAKTDVWVSGAKTSAGTCQVSAEILYYMVAN